MKRAPSQPIDYAAWLHRAEQFVRSLGHLGDQLSIRIELAPPIAVCDLDALAARLSLKLPQSFVHFYTTASACVRLGYSWKPWQERLPILRRIFEHEHSIFGGARFIAPDSLAYHLQGCRDTSAAWYENGAEADVLAAWKYAVPFCDIGNGDLLAYDGRASHAEPPIIYLSHDEPIVTRIGSNFDRFLGDSEQLCYIGPEIWMLQPWLDSESGDLRVARPETAALRQLLISPEF